MLRENRQSSNKDEGLWDVFEIALEMMDRGFHFSPLNLEKSDASNFILDPDDPSGLLPPFSSVDSLGESVAKTVIEARERGPFLSKEDVIKRTKLNNSLMIQQTKMGVCNSLLLHYLFSLCYIIYSFIDRNEWGNPLFIIEWGEKMELLESIKNMVLPFIEQHDCYLDDIEYVKDGNDMYLRIYIEKNEGYLDMDTCVAVSELISDKLDEVDPIKEEYILEVSSPGIEKPLNK